MNSIRQRYQKEGIVKTYINGDYVNPHKDDVQRIVTDFKKEFNISDKKILDLCCGNGEVTEMLKTDNTLVGCDPYLHEQYVENHNLLCLKYDFDGIAFKNVLTYTSWDYIFCSYALHLCEPSKMANLLFQLSLITRNLVIVAPSDVLVASIEDQFGWKMIDQMKYKRTHLFLFRQKA